MNFFYMLIIFCFGILMYHPVNGQEKEIPKEIADQFAMQYPYAANVRCSSNGELVKVNFNMKQETYQAFYKKGTWQYTLMKYSLNRLPSKVLTAFKNSKIKNDKVEDVAVIYLPSGFEEYRIQLKATSSYKKYHYFNEKGRLLHASPIQD